MELRATVMPHLPMEHLRTERRLTVHQVTEALPTARPAMIPLHIIVLRTAHQVMKHLHTIHPHTEHLQVVRREHIVKTKLPGQILFGIT